MCICLKVLCIKILRILREILIHMGKKQVMYKSKILLEKYFGGKQKIKFGIQITNGRIGLEIY